MNSTQDFSSEANFRMMAYIARGRESIQAQFGIDPDADIWQLPSDRAGSSRHKRLNFSLFQGAFKDLMKAVVANTCSSKDGSGVLTRSSFTGAANHLAQATIHLSLISEMGLEHFHHAARLIREHCPEYTAGTKNARGAVLSVLAQELNAHRLTPNFIGFKNPFPPPDGSVGCDEKTAARTRDRLPAEGAMRALGEIYYEIINGASTEQDRLRICAAVLLLCTGFRVNELLHLPVNCWHEDVYRDEEGRIFPACSLSYAPEKGGTNNAMNRIIAPALVGLAKEALDEVLKITKPFRKNALIRFKGGLNVPGLEEGRNYNGTEIGRFLGYVRNVLLLRKDPNFKHRAPGNGKDWCLSAQDIRDLVASRCFEGPIMTFPWRQELHESLFVVSHNFFNGTKAGMTGTAVLMEEGHISDFLGDIKSHQSCFERFGKINPETGKPWKIRTHGFRHMLNTLFQLGGFTADDIASYFGRKDARANENYNHLNARQRLGVLNRARESGELTGPIKEIIDRMKDPIRREAAVAASFGNTQLSPLGICIHPDGAEVPTIPDRCAVCPGLAIIKGHPQLIEETKRQLAVAETTLVSLMDGLSKGYLEDGPWVPLASERRDRLRMMLEIHLDNSVPDGRVIHLGNPKRKKEPCTPAVI